MLVAAGPNRPQFGQMPERRDGPTGEDGVPTEREPTARSKTTGLPDTHASERVLDDDTKAIRGGRLREESYRSHSRPTDHNVCSTALKRDKRLSHFHATAMARWRARGASFQPLRAHRLRMESTLERADRRCLAAPGQPDACWEWPAGTTQDIQYAKEVPDRMVVSRSGRTCV